MTSPEYLLRSLLFVPGHDAKMLLKAAASGADALLPDLEDAVQPAARKIVARQTIHDVMQSGRLGGCPVFPRINDAQSGLLVDDVRELAGEGIAGFVYPKAQSARDISSFAGLLTAIEQERGLPPGHFKIIPLIETAGAVLAAREIGCASPRIIALAFGCEDFLTDVGGLRDRSEDSLFTPRALIAMAARACGVIPIDTVHVDVHDLGDLEKNLVIARKLGFEGALALHPKELPLLHRVFTPTAAEVAEAQEVLRHDAEAREAGKGVAMIEGRFIGPPIVRAARKLLRRHELIAARTR